MQDDLIKLDAPDTPVYLFTGFLEAGKTKFIQETLEDKRFNRGENTLIVLCEEGVEELDPSACRGKGKNLFLRTVDSPEDLTTARLSLWQLETDAERVLIEYNGAWLLDDLYERMPAGWVVYQEFMFADARSFVSYNTNMRQLIFDKLKSCELVVFNRFEKDWDIMPYHKIVRAVNRGCDIAYEHPDGSVDYDTVEDPLPFDKNAPVIEIADRDYAIWYRDLGEELGSYDGKTVRFKAQLSLSDELPEGCVIIGRPMMNCCVEDITFAGLAVEGLAPEQYAARDWVTLCAKITVREHEAYDRAGPVLTAVSIEPADPPEDPVATFY